MQQYDTLKHAQFVNATSDFKHIHFCLYLLNYVIKLALLGSQNGSLKIMCPLTTCLGPYFVLCLALKQNYVLGKLMLEFQNVVPHPRM